MAMTSAAVTEELPLTPSEILINDLIKAQNKAMLVALTLASEKGDTDAQYKLVNFMHRVLVNYRPFDYNDPEITNKVSPFPCYIHELFVGSVVPDTIPKQIERITERTHILAKQLVQQNYPNVYWVLGSFYETQEGPPQAFFEGQHLLESVQNTTLETKTKKDQPVDLKCAQDLPLDPKSSHELAEYLNRIKQYPDFYVEYYNYLALFWYEKAKSLGSMDAHYNSLLYNIDLLIPKTIDTPTRVQQYKACLLQLEQNEKKFTGYKDYKQRVADLYLRIRLETCDFNKLSPLELQEINEQATKFGLAETHFLLAKLYRLNYTTVRGAIDSAIEWIKKAVDAQPIGASLAYAEWMHLESELRTVTLQDMLKVLIWASNQGNIQAAFQYAEFLVNHYNELPPENYQNSQFILTYEIYMYFKLAEYNGIEIPATLLSKRENLLKPFPAFEALQKLKLKLLKEHAHIFFDPQHRKMLNKALRTERMDILEHVLEKMKVLTIINSSLADLKTQHEDVVKLTSHMLLFPLCYEIMMESEQRLAFAMGLHQRLGQASQGFQVLNSSPIFDRNSLLLMFEMAGMPSATTSIAKRTKPLPRIPQ